MNTLKTSIFLQKAKAIHGDKDYDYSKTKYVTSETKVIIRCKKHGEFETTPHSFLKEGIKCRECNKIQKFKKKKDLFIIRANVVHRNKYDYSLLKDEFTYEKVEIICPIHGPFSQMTAAHLNGHGCPKCNGSTGKPVNFGNRKFNNDLFIENYLFYIANAFSFQLTGKPLRNFEKFKSTIFENINIVDYRSIKNKLSIHNWEWDCDMNEDRLPILNTTQRETINSILSPLTELIIKNNQANSEKLQASLNLYVHPKKADAIFLQDIWKEKFDLKPDANFRKYKSLKLDNHTGEDINKVKQIKERKPRKHRSKITIYDNKESKFTLGIEKLKNSFQKIKSWFFPVLNISISINYNSRVS